MPVAADPEDFEHRNDEVRSCGSNMMCFGELGNSGFLYVVWFFGADLRKCDDVLAGFGPSTGLTSSSSDSEYLQLPNSSKIIMNYSQVVGQL